MLELLNQKILEVNARRRVEVLTETMRSSRRTPEGQAAQGASRPHRAGHRPLGTRAALP